jgi:hypothetical protein
MASVFGPLHSDHSMQAPAPLTELQAWMMRAIASSEIDTAAESDRIHARQSQSSSQRLAVYQHAYLARLQECLRETFPVLVTALGRETFDQFAAEYVEHYPPASYSLNSLADRFVEHLIATRPGDVPSPGWPDFLIDLAQLEQTISEVFDGPGSEDSAPLDTGELTKRLPEQWSGLRVAPAACLHLLNFTFPVDDYYTAVKEDQSPPWPDPNPTWLAITRRDYVVRRVPLEQAEHQLLSALIAGQSLGEALSVTHAAAEQVADWFAAWGRLQFFSRLDLHPLQTKARRRQKRL